MRWIALWFLLTCAYLIGLGLSWWISGEAPPRMTWIHLLVVPPAQLVALWMVMSVRRAAADKGADRLSPPDEPFEEAEP